MSNGTKDITVMMFRVWFDDKPHEQFCMQQTCNKRLHHCQKVTAVSVT